MFTANGNKIMCRISALVIILFSVVAFADGDRSTNLQEDVSKAELIKLNLPVGQVLISGTAGNSLKAEMKASCKDAKKDTCKQLLNELAWTRKLGNTTEIGLNPSNVITYDDIQIQINISLPKDKKLEVYQGAGELHMVDTSACLVAELKAGELRIETHENQIASAHLTSTIGDATLINSKNERVDGARAKLVGADLLWSKGTGKCHLEAGVLAGQVTLQLK